uniref:Uncharacterized protein n=1 Tax=Setaria viridis TaxID=4556 RepID=A0A4U6TZK9_SETVI|nr:hypothetical protein SEVIR_7G336900v2 [Setaria viridis]
MCWGLSSYINLRVQMKNRDRSGLKWIARARGLFLSICNESHVPILASSWLFEGRFGSACHVIVCINIIL